MVQLQVHLFAKKRLALKGDAEPCRLKHRQIIGPVADTGGVVCSDAKRGTVMRQIMRLGFTIQDGLAYLAEKHAVLDLKMVGVRAVKAALRRHWLGDDGETTRNQIACRPGRAHGPDKGDRARRQFSHFKGVIDELRRLAGQKRKARIKRLFEIQLATHCAFGDRQNILGQAGDAGHVVQRFRGDHGAVHIGDQEPLAAVVTRDEIDIDAKHVTGRAKLRRKGTCRCFGIRSSPRPDWHVGKGDLHRAAFCQDTDIGGIRFYGGAGKDAYGGVRRDVGVGRA